jgi:hypothetical protein
MMSRIVPQIWQRSPAWVQKSHILAILHDWNAQQNGLAAGLVSTWTPPL